MPLLRRSCSTRSAGGGPACLSWEPTAITGCATSSRRPSRGPCSARVPFLSSSAREALIPPNGLLQLAMYVVMLLALAKPLGDYMARVYQHRASSAQRILGPLERAIYRLGGIDPAKEMGWQTYAAAMLIFNAAGVLFLATGPGAPAVEPRRPGGRGARPVLQHCSQLHDEHELAGVRWRDDAELSRPDGRHRDAELPLGRDRHGHPRRGNSRARPPRRDHDRELLGRHGPKHPLHPAAVVARPRAGPRVRGRHPDVRPFRACFHAPVVT